MRSTCKQELTETLSGRLELRKSCRERRGKRRKKKMASAARVMKMTRMIWTICDDSSTTIFCSAKAACRGARPRSRRAVSFVNFGSF